jgi:ABC-type Mn2+/Zn2+ transport system permease subunit
VSAWLLEPFQYAFFGRAMVAGVLIGAMCGALSVFVVLRRMSYIGHGLAHSVLGGVAVGVAFGLDLYVGAVAATVLSALLIDRVTRRRGLHADAAIGIVTTAIFAIGVGTLSIVPTRINVEALLFGNILGVDRTDLLVAAGVGAVFLVVLFGLYKRLVFTTFDPEVAGVHGVPTGLIELMFSLITAAVVVASVRVLGVLLIAAAVVIPAAIARLVARSFGATLWLATGIGTVSSVVGLYGSFYVDVPSGPTIVLTGALLFVMVFGVTALTANAGRRRATRHHADGDRSDVDRPGAGSAAAASPLGGAVADRGAPVSVMPSDR